MADGLLSQAEINALLGGGDGDDESGSTNDDGGEILSQYEIDSTNTSSTPLTPNEVDALGEIGNINMGTAATTLFALLNHKVMITTPHVEILSAQELIDSLEPDIVTVSVDYTIGLTGSNLLMLKETDVRIIADLMMGGTGVDNGESLNELHLSAISEAMNQMIGSSSTSMSQMFEKKIDISPPHAVQFESAREKIDKLIGNENSVAKISFKMQILEGVIDSELMQILPISFAKELVDNLMNSMDKSSNPTPASPPAPSQSAPQMQMEPQMQMQPQMQPQYAPGMSPSSVYQDVQVGMPQFQNFAQPMLIPGADNIDILLDVSLEVSVELGRTKKKIKEILDFSEGSIIELDKLVGEPIDILVNGKFIASGEVVVIDENFGVRIKSIIRPESRI